MTNKIYEHVANVANHKRCIAKSYQFLVLSRVISVDNNILMRIYNNNEYSCIVNVNFKTTKKAFDIKVEDKNSFTLENLRKLLKYNPITLGFGNMKKKKIQLKYVISHRGIEEDVQLLILNIQQSRLSCPNRGRDRRVGSLGSLESLN